jgi:hypothetical protein
MLKNNKRLTVILLAVTLLLLIPLIAMQFTNDVKWTVLDFIVAGVLLFSTGLMCEFVIRKVKKVKYRIIICMALLTALLFIWLELAVGIFGTPIGGS